MKWTPNFYKLAVQWVCQHTFELKKLATCWALTNLLKKLSIHKRFENEFKFYYFSLHDKQKAYIEGVKSCVISRRAADP